MKPLHIGLLVIGAAIAGGVAVKMTEPPSFPASSPKVVPADVAKPAPAPAPPAQTVPIPPASPPSAEVKHIPASMPQTSTAAPPPVYSEPRSRPTPFPSPAKKQEPEETTISRPAQLPGFYQRPAEPVEPVQVRDVQKAEAPRQVTLEPGMTIAARMLETLSSDRVSAGDTFSATLAEPLIIDGLIIAERGSRVDGRVVSTQRPARINGRSEIQLALSSIMTADGQRIEISTEPWAGTGAGSGSAQAGEIGGGAALGAIIGAIAGGGKGAAIGAGIGSGAGLGSAIATRAKPVTVPTETVIHFRVRSRITITERQL